MKGIKGGKNDKFTIGNIHRICNKLFNDNVHAISKGINQMKFIIIGLILIIIGLILDVIGSVKKDRINKNAKTSILHNKRLHKTKRL